MNFEYRSRERTFRLFEIYLKYITFGRRKKKNTTTPNKQPFKNAAIALWKQLTDNFKNLF